MLFLSKYRRVVTHCKHRCVCVQINTYECYALYIFSLIEFAGELASYGVSVLIIVENYGDVIISAMASQTTSVSKVCSTVCSGTDQRKPHSSTSLAFVRGIHRWAVNSPHKRPVTRKMFPFDDVIMDTAYVIRKPLSNVCAYHIFWANEFIPIIVILSQCVVYLFGSYDTNRICLVAFICTQFHKSREIQISIHHMEITLLLSLQSNLPWAND